MIAPRFRLWVGILLVLASACVSLNAEGFKAAIVDLRDVLKIESRVQPEDPFNKINEKGDPANGKWKARRGQVVRLEFVGTPSAGWYTYPIAQRTPETHALNKWTIDASPGVSVLGSVLESPAVSYYDKDLKTTYFIYVDTFTWTQELFI